jgi:hypothetical protein
MLAERLQRYDRLWRWSAVVVCPVVLLLAFASPSLLPLVMERRVRPPEGAEKWLAVVPSLVIVGVSTLLLILVICCGRWTARKFGLLCPSCGAALTGRYRQAAIGSGSCGHCRARIVEDAPAGLDGVILPARIELLARVAEHQTAYRRQGRPCLAALWLCFLLGALAVWPIVAYLEPFLRPADLAWLAHLLSLVGLVSPLLVFAYFQSRWERRLQQSHELVCPWCGASLTWTSGKRAAQTGRCGGCGQPVCADPA